MGGDVLPGLERHCPANLRLARQSHGTQAPPSYLRRRIHHHLTLLRARHLPLAIDPLSRAARPDRGGLQPLAQAILLETFPKERHGHAMAAFGIGILLAPILGPTLGGWITDNYSWRWIFYLNLPVGILSLFLMNRYVFDPHYVKRGDGKVDLWGIGLLAVGIGSLQVLLDTGQRKDWFSSDYIRIFAGLCIFGLIALIIRELTTDHPVVDLRVLKNHSFSSGRIPDQPSRIRSLRQPGSTAALSPNAHGISRI